MTQKEFKDRTGVTVGAEEFAAIEIVYMNSEVYKDEFCKLWCKMNPSRVKTAKKATKTAKKEKSAMDMIFAVYNRLQLTGAFIRPDLAGDFLSDKERMALIHFNIDIWDEDWQCEKNTVMIYQEISNLIKNKTA